MTNSTPGESSLGRTLFHMTWPMIFGVLALMSFQLVDSVFIGQLGVDPLAVLGFTVPVYQLVIGVQVGIGIGTTALISRVLGAGDAGRAKRLGGLVVTTGGAMMALLCVVLWLIREPLVSALGADARLLPLVGRFWMPWLVSTWVGAMLYFAYSVCRANGDTRLPGLMMVGTSLANMALDPLFIFGFGWGMPGAALATLAAFAVGALVMYRRLAQRSWLSFELGTLPPRPALRQLGAISGPAMFGQLMPGAAALLATTLVAGYGASAVGAWALGSRLEFFSIVVVLGLTMSLPPMVGRYLGAGQLKRARAVVGLAVRFVLVLQLAVALVWLAMSGPLAGLLTPEPAVSSLLRTYLVIVPLSYGGLGVAIIMVSVCNALGMPLRAVLISCCRLFVCFLPAIWLGSQLSGLPGLFAGALVGNLAAGSVAWLLYRRAVERLATGEVVPVVAATPRQR